ncbi:MAG: hypothetical protein GY833_12495 [Aestuariibacter sp.]|nr:hypothetical protein [Aestuariibacter sp.]
MAEHKPLVGKLEPHVEKIIPVSKAENAEQAFAQHSYSVGEFYFVIDRAYADACKTRTKYFYVDSRFTDEIFNIDSDKGFTTPEGAARYIDKQVLQATKRMAKVAALFN